MENNQLKMKNSRTQLKKGFTLIETLVALAIFSFSVLSIVVVTGRGVNDVNYSKNKLSATLLADEGIELVRNLRDTYMLGNVTDGYGWENFVQIADEVDFCGTACTIDPTVDLTELLSGAILPCGGSCPPLKRNDTIGYYNYDSGDETLFTRIIRVDGSNITDIDDALIVTSTVQWVQGATTKSVTVSEPVYNWYLKN